MKVYLVVSDQRQKWSRVTHAHAPRHAPAVRTRCSPGGGEHGSPALVRRPVAGGTAAARRRSCPACTPIVGVAARRRLGPEVGDVDGVGQRVRAEILPPRPLLSDDHALAKAALRVAGWGGGRTRSRTSSIVSRGTVTGGLPGRHGFASSTASTCSLSAAFTSSLTYSTCRAARHGRGLARAERKGRAHRMGAACV
jgi:hypothetical protein